jgi:hypothetical protein
MERRELLSALSASAIVGSAGLAAGTPNTFLEVKTWRFHNGPENQPARVADYLEAGLGPALQRAGAKLAGAFSNVIGPDGPYFVAISEFSSLAALQDALVRVASDETHERELYRLSADPGLPFVRVESSLLRSFDGMPAMVLPESSEKRPPRIFELRTYESQTFLTLIRKIGMFNTGEMQIFERLGMRPVFFGETLIGARQPNLMYMLSYDDLAARDKLWHDFATDPEWRKLSGQPALKDSEIVANISNVILRPLTFSQVR